jgi:hypothetical protein
VETASRAILRWLAPFMLSMIIANFAIGIVLNIVTESRPAFEALANEEEADVSSLTVRVPFLPSLNPNNELIVRVK